MRLIYSLLPFLTLLLLVAARDERAYRGGKAEYRKADLKGETQFQHQKTLDGVVLGCFGYVDGEGNFFATHWMADQAGYRSFKLSNPDSVTLERAKTLNDGKEAPLSDLFPIDCTEKGDMGRLQRMAAKIKEEFESSTDNEEQNRNSPSNVGQGDDKPQLKKDDVSPQTKNDDDKLQPKKDVDKSDSKTPEKKENLRLVNVRDPESFKKPAKKPSRGRKPPAQPVKPTTAAPVKKSGKPEKVPEAFSDQKNADDSSIQDMQDDKRPAFNHNVKSSEQPAEADYSPKQNQKSYKEPAKADDSMKYDSKSAKEPIKADDSPQDEQDEEDSINPKAEPNKGSTDPKLDLKAAPKKESTDPKQDSTAAPKKGSTDSKQDPKVPPKKESNDPKQDPKSAKEPIKADDSPQEEQDEEDSEDSKAAPKKGSTDPKQDPKLHRRRDRPILSKIPR
uniref:Uncharacterized protein n=1 Tax=Anopheles atroparvus TaxID=41427 RepID=A0AAG5DLI4_ANOAO